MDQSPNDPDTGAAGRAVSARGMAGQLARFQAYWAGLTPFIRGAVFVSCGAMTLTIMALFVKQLGQTGMSPLQIQFFRAIVGLAVVLPLFRHDFIEPFRTKCPGLHMVRGFLGASANACLFWGITHLLLADAMALQFARPLWTIPVAMIFLKEFAGLRRSAIAMIGFAGILIYARPFTSGFDPNALIAALGAFFGALVIISIKKLAVTEKTKTMVFYFAFWGVVFSAIPALIVWRTPSADELTLLVIVGVLGIGGQFMLTHGFAKGDATALVPLDYARIAYGALLGWFLFGELPGIWNWVGVVLIVGTSLYLILTERRGGR